MTELEQLCENALYEEMRVLEDGKSVVRDVPTGKLYFKKTLDVYNERVYAFIKDHRNRNVAGIQAYWKDGDKLVVIEELIQGRTLDKILQEAEEATQGGTDIAASGLPFSERIDILTQICDGLQFLHSADPPIIHRDIKASNIMVTDDGVVKIIDYDAAKIYIAGQDKDTMMIGTQGLAAPEQYGFAQSDVRTDLYALGKLIERMLPGNVDAKRIVEKATEMDPKKRYTSAEQMKAQIQRIRENVSGLDRIFEKIPGYDPLRREHRLRARAGLAGACLMVCCLIALGVFFVVRPAQADRQFRAALEVVTQSDVRGTNIERTVTEFAEAYPYASMNAEQQKAVRDGMGDIMQRCFKRDDEDKARQVSRILTEKYGEAEIWDAVFDYAKADVLLAQGNYGEGLEALHDLLEDGAVDAQEHWHAGAVKTLNAARENFGAFSKGWSAYSLDRALAAYMALLPYREDVGQDELAEAEDVALAAEDGLMAEAQAAPAEDAPAAEAQAAPAEDTLTAEVARRYTETMGFAKKFKDDKAWDKAITIYERLRSSGFAERLDEVSGEADAGSGAGAADVRVKEVEEQIKETQYDHAQELFASKSYSQAAEAYHAAGSYKDAEDQYKECIYQQGRQSFDKGKEVEAINLFGKIPGYKDADELLLQMKLAYCVKTEDMPTDMTYDYLEDLAGADYDGYEEVRDEVYRWKAEIETGMNYSLGTMQSAMIRAVLRGGPPDGTAVVRFETYDFTLGETSSWSDGETYKRGQTATVAYSEDDSSYSLFDREYRVRVYVDGELAGTWEGQFSTDFLSSK